MKARTLATAALILVVAACPAAAATRSLADLLSRLHGRRQTVAPATPIRSYAELLGSYERLTEPVRCRLVFADKLLVKRCFEPLMHLLAEVRASTADQGLRCDVAALVAYTLALRGAVGDGRFQLNSLLEHHPSTTVRLAQSRVHLDFSPVFPAMARRTLREAAPDPRLDAYAASTGLID